MSGAERTIFPLKAVQRLALYAQGLTTPNGEEPEPTPEAIMALVDQLVCVQIDTLQRVQRSHYLAIWSRLGTYAPSDLDELVYADPASSADDNRRRLFEYWFHAACLLPLSEYRYRVQRMHSIRRGRAERSKRWLAKSETQNLLSEVYARVKRDGALMARDFEDPAGGGGTWWNWKPAKSALEHLFSRGDLMIADRVRFQRVYDLSERVLPDWVDTSEPSPEETTRHVLERTMYAAGICAENQLADYCHDFNRTEVNTQLHELLEEGLFRWVRARLWDGEPHALILHRDRLDDLRRCADGEIRAERTTFLNPFDTLFYLGNRDEQLWGFRQILEAYKPVEKRIWGYYCLPILLGTDLIGRFDPRLDRKAKRLHIERLHLEPGFSLKSQSIEAIVDAMRDFMRFHDANELVVEHKVGSKHEKQLAEVMEDLVG